MERDQIPVIGLQIAIMSAISLGILWLLGHIPHRETPNAIEFLVAFTAIVVIFNTIITQVVYNIWKIIGGFSFYDVTKILCNNVHSKLKKQQIQIAFDNFWHNDKNINKAIIDYSRRRSVVCQMNLFASWILFIAGIIFFIFIFIFNCKVSATLSGISLVLAVTFYLHYKITSSELIQIEKKNILLAKRNKKEGYDIFNAEIYDLLGKDLISILCPKQLSELYNKELAEDKTITKTIVKEKNHLFNFLLELLDFFDSIEKLKKIISKWIEKHESKEGE